MNLLLDTHVALWYFNDPARVREAVYDAIEDGDNLVHLSSASVWEAAIKEAIGRLTVPEPLESAASTAGFVELPVTWGHARAAAALPPLHADPFDRMLVAQAAAKDLVLVTRDARVAAYPVATMLA